MCPSSLAKTGSIIYVKTFNWLFLYCPIMLNNYLIVLFNYWAYMFLIILKQSKYEKDIDSLNKFILLLLYHHSSKDDYLYP